MPVRITCPSCSAGLSIRDEFASRAVKCPKCGGLIPPQPAVPTVSEAEAVATVPSVPEPPPPAPEPPAAPEPVASAPEPEPPPPPAPKLAPAAVAPPAPAPNPFEALDEDDRPRRRKRRDARDDDDDRPRRRRDDDDDDDRPRRRRKRAKSNAPLILGGVVILLLACAGVGYGVYAMMSKTEPEAAKGTPEKPAAPPVAAEKYEKVKINDTRVQVETVFGKAARPATVADVSKVFRAPADQKKIDDWAAKAKARRAVIWQGADESYVLVAFYPNTTAGQVQAKEWRSRSGDGAGAGELDDDEFLKKHPPKDAPPGPGVPREELTGPAIEIAAIDLTRAVQDDMTAATAKYEGKVLVVTGTVTEVREQLGGVDISLKGTPFDIGGNNKPVTTGVWCIFRNEAEKKRAMAVTPGQTVVVRGVCAHVTKLSTVLADCALK